MKITKRQLRKIIKEERNNLLKEQSMGIEALSPLVEFGNAWSGLGSMVAEQMTALVNAYIENDDMSLYDNVNRNAFDTAKRRLMPPLMRLGETNPDAEEVLEAFEWAQGIYDEGDAEVDADARAAGDM